MLFTRSNKLCRFYLYKTFTTPYHRRANLLRIRPSTLRIYKTRKPSQLKNHKILNAWAFPSSQFPRPRLQTIKSTTHGTYHSCPYYHPSHCFTTGLYNRGSKLFTKLTRGTTLQNAEPLISMNSLTCRLQRG